MKYKRYKGEPLNRGGDLPYFVKIDNDFIDMVFEEVKEVYYFLVENFYKIDPSTHSAKNCWHIIKEKFPFIYEFKQKYSMSDYMNFLGFDKPDITNAYLDKPHTHNSSGGANFFVEIIPSVGAATAFYDPPEEDINTLEYEYDDGWVLKLEECVDKDPDQIVSLQVPHIICSNHFHKPYEVIYGHPDNIKRISLNWESKLGFKEIVGKLNE